MRHRELNDLVAGVGQLRHGRLDGCRGTADDGLTGAVDVCDHHISVDGINRFLDRRQRRKDGSHQAAVLHLDMGHLSTAAGDRHQRLIELERARSHQSPVFAEAVPHHHVRLDAVCGQESGQCYVDGEHCGLGYLGLHQIELGGSHRSGVIAIDEDVVRQRFAEDRSHDCVSFREGGSHDRLRVAEGVQHVDVL